MAPVRGDTAAELDAAILEMAQDARETGALNDTTFDRLVSRQLGSAEALAVTSMLGPDIRALREDAHMSQAVFARWLNMTPGYVSQLERGIKRPAGPALVLLHIIKRHGMALVVDGADASGE